MQKTSIRLVIIFFIAVFIATYIYLGTLWVDPDYGWHIRIGEIIFKTGLPNTNPFSFTMPSYPYIDHEWILNVFYYLSDYMFGYPFLVFTHLVLAIITPFFVLKSTKGLKKVWVIPLLLLWSSFMLRFGVRPQIFSWLFLAILIYITNNQTMWDRSKWLLPPLALVWANLHGSYIFAIGIMALVVIFKSIKNKEVVVTDFIVLLLSIFATFINPYGVRSWTELIKQMTIGSGLKRTLAEWIPSVFFFDPGFLALTTLTGTLIFMSKKKIYLLEKLSFLAIAFFGFYASRFIPLSMLLMSAYFLKNFHKMGKMAAQKKHGTERFNKFYHILVIISFLIFLSGFIRSTNYINALKGENFYPVRVANFIKAETNQKNIFTNYNYGGYLIWKLPDRKFFVDGRMDGFSWDAPSGESDNAYKDYLDIACGYQDFNSIIGRYKVEMVIAEKKDSTPKMSRTYFRALLPKLSVKLGLSYCTQGISIIGELKKHGWKNVYEDDRFIVFTP